MSTPRGITSGEQRTNTLLKFAPGFALMLLALPVPLYFLVRYFAANEDAAVWLLFAVTTFGVGLIAGILAAFALVLYSRSWRRKMRDRIARDGVTVADLPWFMSELTAIERRTLASVNNHLLADAYRETIAARLTATRLVKRTGNELALVERRLQQARSLPDTERPSLERELTDDRTRLAGTRELARRQETAAEARLQSIAAAASRETSEADSRIALERLGGASGAALALENAKLLREYEAQSRRELER